MSIKLIAAVDEDLGIGKDGKLPWYFPEDLKHFYQLTRQSCLLMGRKTHDSLPGVLKERVSLVLSRRQEWDQLYPDKKARVMTVPDLGTALALCPEGLWVIGGEQIFRQTLTIAHEIHLTRIPGRYGCDAFFPGVPDDFDLTASISRQGLIYEHWVQKSVADNPLLEPTIGT